jgi:hypothetical protein
MATAPNEIVGPIVEIIGNGIGHARMYAWAGDAAQSAIESDHVHTLPWLLLKYTPEGLRHYLEVMRPGYLKYSKKEASSMFQLHWDRLDEFRRRATSDAAG